MEASLRCWFCNVAAFTQSLIHACVICLSRSWARFQRAVLPALASEEELQEMFKRVKRAKRESARTRASF